MVIILCKLLVCNSIILVCLLFAILCINLSERRFAMTSKHEQEFKMIGLNIAYFRKLKGISQMKLAETIGISRTHMSNIEAPTCQPPFLLRHLWILQMHLISRHMYCCPFTQMLRLIHLLFN